MIDREFFVHAGFHTSLDDLVAEGQLAFAINSESHRLFLAYFTRREINDAYTFWCRQAQQEPGPGEAGTLCRLESAGELESPSGCAIEVDRLDCPAHATVGTRTSLSVRLLLAPSDPQTSTATAVSIEDTAQQPPDVEIVLSARGCDIEDSNTQKLQVARDADSAVRFVIVPRQKGEQTIKAEFYQRNRYIGTVERTIQVTTKPRARSTEAPTPPARVLEFASASAVAPDLELRIETDRRNDKILYFTLHSTVEAVDYHHAPVGEVRLKGSPLKKMQAVYKELNEFAGNAPATPAHIAVQRKRLENLGKNLWDELFPAELKAAYWQFREHVKTLLITSDEPWIPWEIVKPYSLENGRIEEPFLCEKFVVARWLAGHGPADRMPIKNLRPVVPPSDLQSVQDELRYLETVNQLRDGIVPDAPYNDRARVIELLESGTFSVLHIAAHGSFDDTSPDNASIELSDGPLCPSDIFARFGGTRPRPLVFLNACHGARTEFAFTGLGGWADRLVGNACVGAFIGAAWEVNDHLALQFAETFYTALLRDNRTIGESFRLARQTIRDAEPSNSTWLAYVLYADPGAMMTR
jgi:hypothetical protein